MRPMLQKDILHTIGGKTRSNKAIARQDKIKQDNHKTRTLQDNTCLCLTVKADKQKFFFTVTFLTINIAQCIAYYTTAKEGSYSSEARWALYTVHIVAVLYCTGKLC